MTTSIAHRCEPITAGAIAKLAVEALRREVELTPKPGLVDRDGNGAHRDMDLPLFRRSIAAIAPWFSRFVTVGELSANEKGYVALSKVRPVGLACEQDMFRATGGVNTHKGGIFSLGLLCTAAGRLAGKQQAITSTTLCQAVSSLSAHLVEQELVQRRRGVTVGERLYQQYGMKGARGEAASGFMTVRQYALPAWQQACKAGYAEEQVLWHVLLTLMAHNCDTNLVSRGGLAGLRFVQRQARQLLEMQDAGLAERRRALIRLDQRMTADNLSPGGSADLLAVTWLLAQYPC
ncbi:triphosphoribosyl-dephospho-CoA synthase CitG [Serratia fonticola]